MARIFNIYFPCQDVMRNAIVTERTAPFYTEYHLTLDPDLLLQLPGNKIIRTSPDYFSFPNIPAHENNMLMKEIIRAVANHLQAHKVSL